jgi:hypothetical protein
MEYPIPHQSTSTRQIGRLIRLMGRPLHTHGTHLTGSRTQDKPLSPKEPKVSMSSVNLSMPWLMTKIGWQDRSYPCPREAQTDIRHGMARFLSPTPTIRAWHPWLFFACHLDITNSANTSVPCCWCHHGIHSSATDHPFSVQRSANIGTPLCH